MVLSVCPISDHNRCYCGTFFPARWPQESHPTGKEVASNTSGTVDVSSGHTLPQQLSNSIIQGSAATGFSQTPDQVEQTTTVGIVVVLN